MRQQREILGKHGQHFLAGYISMFAGQGPFQTGFTRYVVIWTLLNLFRISIYAFAEQTCPPYTAEKLMRP
jgi:uncharacterized membrane protein